MTSFSTLTRTLSRNFSRRHALRSVCLAATVVAGLAPATGALAQTAGYPNKPVRIIVGFQAPGRTSWRGYWRRSYRKAGATWA